MILVFTEASGRRRSRQLDLGGRLNQPESEAFADATIGFGGAHRKV